MNRRSEEAVKYKLTGYNCCQAVLLAYKDKLGLDERVLEALGAGFVLGMGTTEGTCGALCGAEQVMSLLEYEGKPLRFRSKEIFEEFKERCGATACKDIKGLETGEVLCSCPNCVKNAVDILEDLNIGK